MCLMSATCCGAATVGRRAAAVNRGAAAISRRRRQQIIRLVVDGKLDVQILFGARSEKRKIYLVPNDSYEKNYLAVKGLTHKDGRW